MIKYCLILAVIHVLMRFNTVAIRQPEYLLHSCLNDTVYAPNSSYASDLRTLLSSLTFNSSLSRFHSASYKNIQALYHCRGDISMDECIICVSAAATDVLTRCPKEKTAAIWYENCLVRFSNETIVSVAATSPTLYMYNTVDVPVSERALFTVLVRNDLNDCATVAANTPSKFAVKETNTYYNFSITNRIYSLVQCTEDLSDEDCGRCLQELLEIFPACCSSAIGADVFNPSCNFRYETRAFYNISGITVPSPPLAPASRSSNSGNAHSDLPTSSSHASFGKSGILYAAILTFLIYL